jgi:radical SAM superfamily enzyme YgiQ (UPF0313 family)
VIAKDFGALNGTWHDVCRLLVNQFDLIAVFNDFDAISGFRRFMDYTAELCPSAKTVTFGRGSRHIAQFFKQYGFDAIAHRGDYEISVGSFAEYLTGEAEPRGLLLRAEGYETSHEGAMLGAEDWVLPDVTEIPYADYDRMYADDMSKFCGIPERRELIVPAARGCPIGCAFCDVPAQQGLHERRLTVERTVEYIDSSYAKLPFDYVSFYAPTFTLKRNWVLQLCEALRVRVPDLRWKCVTTLSHLDRDLVTAMGQSGCVRIGVGIETLSSPAAAGLPTLKALGNQRLDAVAEACANADIELNCFLMLGMPREELEDTTAGIATLIGQGHRVRPTIYTPYELMSAEMSEREYGQFNRQLIVNSMLGANDRAIIYNLLYNNRADRPTRVVSRIPSRAAGESL